MKKILLVICLSAASLTIFAQSVSYGVKGGVNVAKWVATVEGSSASVSSETLTSFNAGVFVDFKLSKFSIQPSINLTGKGSKYTNMPLTDNNTGTSLGNGDVSASLLYLQVPVDLLYHVNVAAGDIFFGAGPFLAFGLSGKAKIVSPGLTASEDVTFGSGPDDIKSTDAGLNFTAGFKFKKGVLFNVNYDLGLTNTANNTGPVKIMNRVWGFSVGYAF